MSEVQNAIRTAIVRLLVQRAIVCPVTDEVLDVRTCVVLLDRDGDPRIVLSQAGYQERKDALTKSLGAQGWTVDEATIEAPVSEPAEVAEPVQLVEQPGQHGHGAHCVNTIQYLAAERIVELQISEEPANAHAPNGYGGKLATSMLVKLDDNRWRRVYAMAYGNWFSAYVIVDGIDHFLSAEAEAKIADLKPAAREAWEGRIK
jgi:hypothetical protein